MFEDVGEDYYAVVFEGGFVEELGAVAQGVGGFVEAALALGVGDVNKVTSSPRTGPKISLGFRAFGAFRQPCS